MKFAYNGIRTSDKKLIKGHFNFCTFRKCVTFYASDYGSLNQEMKEKFKVKNDSDSMTDYFEKDRFVINQGEEFFPEACKASIALIEKTIKNIEKRLLTPKGKRNEAYYLDEIKGKRQLINMIQENFK